MTEPRGPWAARGHLLRAALLGVFGGALLTLALFLTGGEVRTASSTAFALGALVFGFGLTVWASTVWIGDAIEAYLAQAVGDTDWSKERAGAAFSLLTVAGFGAMVGASLVTALLRL